MPPISFFNQHTRFSLKDKNALRRWITASAKKEGHAIQQLNYIFCTDKYLIKINNQYLEHDEYTDIITFDHSLQKTKINGEIFISIDRIKENAKTYRTTFANELHRVMIHGVLHLCGYNDKTKKQKAEIKRKEDYCLNLRSF